MSAGKKVMDYYTVSRDWIARFEQAVRGHQESIESGSNVQVFLDKLRSVRYEAMACGVPVWSTHYYCEHQDAGGVVPFTEPIKRMEPGNRFTASQLEQLIAFKSPTWDGDVISKATRDELVNMGLVVHVNGWQMLSAEGLKVLIDLGHFVV